MNWGHIGFRGRASDARPECWEDLSQWIIAVFTWCSVRGDDLEVSLDHNLIH